MERAAATVAVAGESTREQVQTRRAASTERLVGPITQDRAKIDPKKKWLQAFAERAAPVLLYRDGDEQ